MKRIKDEVSLVGKCETISMTEFRNNPGEILLAVELGKSFVIKRHDEPVAVLSRVPGETLALVHHSDGSVTYESSNVEP